MVLTLDLFHFFPRNEVKKEWTKTLALGIRLLEAAFDQPITAALTTEHKVKIRAKPECVRPNEVRELIGNDGGLKGLIDDWQAHYLGESLGSILKKCTFCTQ
jgi:hypothetical protein